jgi:nucleoside-diphosphate-sugar epimerase
MTDALIGYTGFVGSTLLRQRTFGAMFRSTDVHRAADGRFGTVVCAGAPAQKWAANRDPAADQAGIRRLVQVLGSVECERFVLISTVDVFARPAEVDEDSPVTDEGLHAYGRHRLMLERFVESRFERRSIVRLPGLVGPGLRKNVIYDLHHGNNLDAIDSRSIYQFYPMVNLWADLQVALANDLPLVHLTSEPTSVADVATEGFGVRIDQRRQGEPARYEMRSRHAGLFGAAGTYQYSRREVLTAVRAYAQSEPKGS